MSMRHPSACLRVVLLALVALAPAHAAVPQTGTIPYPDVTANGREWFQSRQAIFFAGDAYWPVGPDVFYDADVMVVTGTFDGVPLFADTSITPYDQVLVPIGRGLLRPYERRREGALAGTTGSRLPSFPVDPSRSAYDIQPWPQRPDPDRRAPQHTSPPEQPAPPDETTIARGAGRVETVRRPQGNRGIWIRYEGTRWEAAGEGVEYEPGGFRQVGTYRGFPVYRRSAGQAADEIFIPMRGEILAPYRRAADAR